MTEILRGSEMVSRLAHNQDRTGSIPVPATIIGGELITNGRKKDSDKQRLPRTRWEAGIAESAHPHSGLVTAARMPLATLSNAVIYSVLFLSALAVGPSSCLGREVTADKIADAIYMAEGGENTAHPYGILKKYKATTPRQACINTVHHAFKDWDGKGDFIAFLGGRYAPVGVANDPAGLNKNWIRNVKYFLRRSV